MWGAWPAGGGGQGARGVLTCRKRGNSRVKGCSCWKWWRSGSNQMRHVGGLRRLKEERPLSKGLLQSWERWRSRFSQCVDEVQEGPCQLEVEKPIQAEMEEVYKSPLQPGPLDKTCGGLTTVPARSCRLARWPASGLALLLLEAWATSRTEMTLSLGRKPVGRNRFGRMAP